MKYRNDIDGLRAVAILPIVLFHFGVTRLSGGYVGVDIFFVISGYLISKIIHEEIKTDVFSIKKFYARRARRILPALLSVLLITSLGVCKIFYPIELIAYGKSVLASLFFSANLYFYYTLNYFSPAADQIPLLHLWSLGLEEQFYLVFPLLLRYVILKFPQKLPSWLVFALVLSAVLSAYMLKITPSMAFYLLPFRAFEFLIGCIIGIVQLPRFTDQKFAFITSLIGFLGILFSILFFKITTPFPGFYALIPCLGTGLIIWSGEGNYFNQLLSSRLLVGIGKISYSLYLIHWPLIVLAKRLYPDMNYSKPVALSMLLALLMFLAFLNYRFIEQSFRRATHFSLKKQTIAFTSFLSLLYVSAFTFTLHQQVVSARLNQEINRVTAYLYYNSKPLYQVGTCFQDIKQKAEDMPLSSCLPKKNKNKVILWGDSHAMQLYPGLKKILEPQGYSLGVLTSCPPIMAAHFDSLPNCKKFNDVVLPMILKEQPKLLIMTAVWPVTPFYMDMLEKTIQHIAKYPIKIILLGESPIYKQNVPAIIAERLKQGESLKGTPDMLDLNFLSNAEKVMTKRFSNRSDVTYISVMDIMCPHYYCPLVTRDNVPVHFDIAHLTAEGSDLFAEKLTPLILKERMV